MPLFRKEQPTITPSPVLTINGRPQPTPETPATLERRNRLYTECERRLADDPLTQESARGRLVGDGNGLEGVVAKIAPLFEREQSLIRWVALRGAFTNLYGFVFDPNAGPGRATRSPEALADVMGLAWVDEAGNPYTARSTGRAVIQTAESSRDVPEDLREVALNIAKMSIWFASDYPRISSMSTEEVAADSMCTSLNDIIALDCIAWTAVALLRLGLSQLMMPKVPEPDALVQPGWYVDPLFGKFERYWDGSDWTSKCRRQVGREIITGSAPLH